MKLVRRRFLQLAAAAVALPALPRIARAQDYPTGPVRIIVGFATGGSGDVFARLIGQWLSEQLSQAFIIEDRPGAGTNIATEAVVRAAPDGHTLLMAGTANAINATYYDNLKFNFIRDVAPVASVVRQPLVMVLSPSISAKTIREFIDYAKANPGRLTMASAGVGTPGHVSGEMFKVMAGIDVVHVPYRGAGPAIADLLSGRTQFSFAGMAAAIGYIRRGQLRPLAVTTARRSETLPEIPSLGESLPGYEASTWFGIAAPKGTPVAIVDKLNTVINAALASPKINARFADLGGSVLVGSPANFKQFIIDETDKWAKVLRSSGAKAI